MSIEQILLRITVSFTRKAQRTMGRITSVQTLNWTLHLAVYQKSPKVQAMYFINYLEFVMFLCAPSLVRLSHLCRVSRVPCVVVNCGLRRWTVVLLGTISPRY